MPRANALNFPVVSPTCPTCPVTVGFVLFRHVAAGTGRSFGKHGNSATRQLAGQNQASVRTLSRLHAELAGKYRENSRQGRPVKRPIIFSCFSRQRGCTPRLRISCLWSIRRWCRARSLLLPARHKRLKKTSLQLSRSKWPRSRQRRIFSFCILPTGSHDLVVDLERCQLSRLPNPITLQMVPQGRWPRNLESPGIEDLAGQNMRRSRNSHSSFIRLY